MSTDVPGEITLTGPTVQILMTRPDIADQIDAARAEHGTAGVIGVLDEHGLTWRAGGSDPFAAFADAGVRWAPMPPRRERRARPRRR